MLLAKTSVDLGVQGGSDDDLPEEKCSPEKLGAMHMTPTVKLSLLALRVYLILIVMLVFCSVLHQACLDIKARLLEENRQLVSCESRRFSVHALNAGPITLS